jgi:hypothetical protein
MQDLCDGSRRSVRGERHELNTSTTRHMTATCPVCKRTLTVKRVLGVLEFPRHERREKKAQRR